MLDSMRIDYSIVKIDWETAKIACWKTDKSTSSGKMWNEIEKSAIETILRNTSSVDPDHYLGGDISYWSTYLSS